MSGMSQMKIALFKSCAFEMPLCLLAVLRVDSDGGAVARIFPFDCWQQTTRLLLVQAKTTKQPWLNQAFF